MITPAQIACIASGGNVVTPKSLSSNQLWLRASVGVTTGATFTWADQSGKGHDATQSTAARQPTVGTSTDWAGRTVVSFLRTSTQWLACNGLAAMLSGTDKPFTVITALRAPTNVNHRIYLGWGHSATSAYAWVDVAADNGLDMARQDDALANEAHGTAPGAIDNAPHIVSVVHDGTTFAEYLDGSALTLAVNTMNVGASAFDLCTIGARRDSGGATSFPFNGDICEIAVFDAACTPQQRRAVERGMRQRCGTP